MRKKGCRWFVSAGVFWLVMLVLGFSSPCRPEVSGRDRIVSEITVLVQDPSPDAPKLQALAKRLIFIDVGDPFSIDALQESIEALKRSGLFRKVHVPDPMDVPGGRKVVFELTSFSLIKAIEIDGEFPLLERDVLNAMDIRVADPFDPKKVSKWEKDILRRFQDDGYIHPQVHVAARQDPADGRTLVTVSIEKGPYYRVHRVTLEGNRFFSDMGLLPRLKTWQALTLFAGMSRFVKADLKRDVKTVINLYRDHGYADVTVEPAVEKDAENKTVDIVLRIREGPRYEILFTGNTAFSDATLKKELPLFQRGNKGDLALKRGIRTIQNRYKNAGFSRVEVNVSDETEKRDDRFVRSIRIRIDEGPRFLVKRLAIQGNRAIEEERIKDKLLTRPPGLRASGAFSSQTWEEDKRAVKELYYQNGYRKITLKDTVTIEKDPEKNLRWVDILLHIEEGVQTLVGDVAFHGLSVLTKEEAMRLVSLTPGVPYREYMVTSDKNALAAVISEKGYPYSGVSAATTLRDQETVADILYEIHEGPFVTVGGIYVRGNFRTRKSVIADRLAIRQEEVFSLKKIFESTRNVSRIQALEGADLQLVGYEEKKDEVDVMFHVAEKRPYLFEIGAGYDTAREYYLLGRLENRNLLGVNKRIWLGGDYSRISHRGEAGISDPDFFRSGISASGTLFTEKQEKKNQIFGIRNYGGTLGFQKPVSETVRAGLAFRYEARKQYRLNDEPIPPEDQEQYEPRTLFVVTPSLDYTSVDSTIRPKKGFIARTSVDASKGLDNTIDDFFRYRLEARYYYTPVNRLTLAARAGAGLMHAYSPGDDVADDQLFYLGGLGSVRGFHENKLRTDAAGNAMGGRVELFGNMEARYALGAGFEASLFYDFGAVRDAEKEEGDDGFRSSLGVGLSYITPVGPISLMYGHKLDRKEDESAGRIHFSIGYTF
ncbi:MAG: outer membrane protein assembly factor BamA [Deltaproteobacteria bacterium]|nr:outer membrane protein assembly factor BamA [Deltaproteobacteria bacterium]